ncbi:hypothetical protein PAEPH01_1084 [Pancytospora epiphaga]|nr:hypothetical protein PAEPH01_1084 [Pancytospora epiphaga]
MTGFPDPSDKINNRKSKVLSFVEKDLFIVNNYESVPFKNVNHAVECLIPYHIFQIMADDIKFKGSDIDIELSKELDILFKKLETAIEEIPKSDGCFVPQLLLYYEQKYINSLINNAKTNTAKVGDPEPVKQNCFLRIPKSTTLYVYGEPSKLRMRIKQ